MERIVSLGARSYPLYIERGALRCLSPRVNLARKVLLVTDEGVPESLRALVLSQCGQGFAEVLPMGEDSKSFSACERLCARMLRENFTRKDLVLALGGGVIGDLAGFAASIYMRGIDFVNLPTTTLSQIDSSVGGKTAINFCGVKNIVGAFHQPRAVFLDADALASLPERHFVNGLAEALKMGLICDPEILALFEKEDWRSHIEELITRADVDPEKVFAALTHDKKGDATGVSVVVVDRPGHYLFRKMSYDELRARVFAGVDVP